MHLSELSCQQQALKCQVPRYKQIITACMTRNLHYLQVIARYHCTVWLALLFSGQTADSCLFVICRGGDQVRGAAQRRLLLLWS